MSLPVAPVGAAFLASPGASELRLQSRLALPYAAPLPAPEIVPTLFVREVPRVAPLATAEPGPSREPEAAKPLSTALAERAALLPAGASDPLALRESLDRIFIGESPQGATLINDEGVKLVGRAARYYREVRRLVDKWDGKQDLSESLDVMEDSYEEVWSKLKGVEAVARSRKVDHHNTHLEETLVWVDGVLQDGNRKVAVHTHRTYYHHAKNPASEVAEGIRRVDGYLREAMGLFAKSGKAEQALGRLSEIVLVFDTRGYDEIKSHIRKRYSGLTPQQQSRFRFLFLDELVTVPKDPSRFRTELNEMTQRYAGRGLDKIIEGVIYSRYVGLLLELRTVDYLLTQGYRVLQSGRELFDEKGMYITELDVVARSPEGKVQLIEAKSARVPLPFEDVLADKVVRKLEVYARHRQQLNESIGAPFDEVVFSIDVGDNLELSEFLKGQEKALSQRYGFPVRFLFLQSFPGEQRPLGR